MDERESFKNLEATIGREQTPNFDVAPQITSLQPEINAVLTSEEISAWEIVDSWVEKTYPKNAAGDNVVTENEWLHHIAYTSSVNEFAQRMHELPPEMLTDTFATELFAMTLLFNEEVQAMSTIELETFSQSLPVKLDWQVVQHEHQRLSSSSEWGNFTDEERRDMEETVAADLSDRQ